jgi:hypothetical protein
MRHGAVVMLDALGFKGIWERVDPETLLEKLRALKRMAFQDAEALYANVPLVRASNLDLMFLSDTIVLASSSEWSIEELSSESSSIAALQFHLDVVCSLAQLSIVRAMDIPLAYRGCITVGSFEVAESFVLGPAIDDAARAERSADGAFVWLHAYALECLEKAARIHSENRWILEGNLERLLIDYDVPTKGGTFINTKVVNPLANPGGIASEVLEQQVTRFMASFSPLSDQRILSKKTNTEKFLRSVRAA